MKCGGFMVLGQELRLGENWEWKASLWSEAGDLYYPPVSSRDDISTMLKMQNHLGETLTGTRVFGLKLMRLFMWYLINLCRCNTKKL